MPGKRGRSGGKRPGAGRKSGLVDKAKKDLVEMAKEHAPAALQTLVSIHSNSAESAGARVSAANSIIERGYGKAPQALELTGAAGGDIRHDVRIIIVDPKAR